MSTCTRVVPRRVAICLALSVALIVPAFGTASAEVSTAKAPCQKPSGEPIPFAYIATLEGPASENNFSDAVTASVKSINCAGGVKGRPIELHPCNGNSLLDPNLPTKCAREAIERDSVVSVAATSLDGAVPTALDAAGIPSVGTAFVVEGLTLPTFFNVTGGIPATLAGMAAKLYDDGARKIRVVSLDAPGVSQFLKPLADLGLESRGASVLDSVLFPADPSADDSALVQAAITGADALILLTTLDSLNKVVPEIEAAGFKGKMGITVSVIPPDEPVVQKKSLVLNQGLYPPSATEHKAIRDFNADMKRFAPKHGRKLIEADVQAWLAVQIAADALKQAETIDAAGLLKALNAYKVPFDVGPTLDFTKPGAFGLPRLFTTEMVPVKNVKKNYLQDGPIVDAAAPPATGSTATTTAK